jgi:hypothetical protein
MRNVSNERCRDNKKRTNIFKNCLCDTVEKYGRARQSTDDNVIRHTRFARWITKLTATCRIRNTYWFSMATMFTRTRINATCTYIACLVET